MKKILAAIVLTVSTLSALAVPGVIIGDLAPGNSYVDPALANSTDSVSFAQNFNLDTNGAGTAAALLVSNNIAASGTAANALYANAAGSAALATTATTATAVTGGQSNLIATALQSIPANYLTTNGNGSALTGITAGQVGAAPSTVTNLTSTQVGLIATSIQPGQTNSIISTATNLAAANAAQYANQVTGAAIVAAGAVTNVSLSTNSSGVNGTVVTTSGTTTLTLTNTASGGGVTTNVSIINDVAVINGTNIFHYPSLTNAISSGKIIAGSTVEIGAMTNWMSSSFIGTNGYLPPPNVAFQGSGTNLSVILFETNCFVLTNGLLFKEVSLISTRPVSNYSPLVYYSAFNTGLNCQGVSLNNVLVNSGPDPCLSCVGSATNNVGIAVNGGNYISDYGRCFLSTTTPVVGSFNFTGGTYDAIVPTNGASVNLAAISLSTPATGLLTNTFSGVNMIANANGTTNSIENIGVWGTGSAMVFKNGFTYSLLNTNNAPWHQADPILLEDCYSISTDGTIPSYLYVEYGSPPTTSITPSDTLTLSDPRKMGGNEVFVTSISGAAVINKPFYDIPSGSILNFGGGATVGISYSDFYNRFYGLSNSLAVDFSSFPTGVTNNIVVSNSTFTVEIYSTDGLSITNINGMNTLISSNLNSYIIVSNIGSAFTTFFAGEGGYSSGAQQPIWGPTTVFYNAGLSQNIGGSCFGWFNPAVTNISYVQFRGGTSNKTTMTNLWCGKCFGGERGKQIYIP